MTAFTIESYGWLQPNPLDAQVQLLRTISNQLQDINQGNSTATIELSPSPFAPVSSSVRVNIFWFTSLTLSLIAVLVGILCKQWLREYQRYQGLSAKDAFPVRQLRYEGLLGWHVPTILSSLPLLLQAALILFFGGLLDLLWTINTHVASVVSIIVGIAMILLIVTTMAPCVQNLMHLSKLWPSHYREPRSQCAFKSPQSWAFYILITWLISYYSRLKQYLFYGSDVNYLQLQLDSWHSNDANWVKYDFHWQLHGKFIQRGINWFNTTFARGQHNVDAIHNIFHCLASLETNISAECVSMIIRDNWSPLVALVGLVQPVLRSFYGLPTEEDMDVDPVFAKDMVLASFLVIHHKTSTSVSSHCLERCARMLNSPSLTENLSSVILETLNIVVSGSVPSEGQSPLHFLGSHISNSGLIILATELASQLMVSMSTLFKTNLIQTEDLATLWAVLSQLMSKTNAALQKPDNLSCKSLKTVVKQAQSWLTRILESSDIPTLEKQLSVQKCSIGVSNIHSYLKPKPHDRDVSPENTEDGHSGSPLQDFQHLGAFILLIDGFLHRLGGPNVVLSMYDLEVWNIIKEEYAEVVKDERE